MAEEKSTDELREGESLVVGSDPDACYKAAFRISGNRVDPNRLASLVEPATSTSRFEGQLYGRSSVRARENRWSVDSKDHVPEHAALEEHVVWVLDTIEPALPAIAELIQAGCPCDMFCALFMGEWNSSIVLTPATMGRLSAAKIELGVDIYGPVVPDAIRRIALPQDRP